MKREDPLKGGDREALLEELHRRYSDNQSWRRRWLYLRKKYAWLFFVEGTRVFKRVLDIVLSFFFLLLFSPFFLLVPLLIKTYDGGPVFYTSLRLGKWGKEFVFPKFRTMHVNADQLKGSLQEENVHGQDKLFKMKNDPRMTPIGKYLRKFSIDELPQLWCVLKGDMSLVGPRPPLPEEVAKYTVEERSRLEVKPGMTGLWQVSGRSDVPFEKQLELDLEYIRSQSIWMDCKILLKTIPAVLFGRGAY